MEQASALSCFAADTRHNQSSVPPLRSSRKLEIHEEQPIMMNRKASYWLLGGAAALAPLIILAAGIEGSVTTGQAAFQDYSQVKTGAFRKITAADLPEPFATKSS